MAHGIAMDRRLDTWRPDSNTYYRHGKKINKDIIGGLIGKIRAKFTKESVSSPEPKKADENMEINKISVPARSNTDDKKSEITQHVFSGKTTAEELIKSIRNHDVNRFQQIIDAGVDVNAHDEDGMTALHHAAESGSRACIRALVRSGKCDYSLKNNNGRTASELAFIWSRDYGVGRLLVKKEVR